MESHIKDSKPRQVVTYPTLIPYLGSVRWYRHWMSHRLSHVRMPMPDSGDSLRTALIRGAWGNQNLCIPVRGGRRMLTRMPFFKLAASEHDDWRHKHWQAITSAYGALPYFPYFKDDFNNEYMHGPVENIAAFNRRLHEILLQCSGLDTVCRWLARHDKEYAYEKRQCDVPDDVSCLELLFRYGPETVFYL